MVMTRSTSMGGASSASRSVSAAHAAPATRLSSTISTAARARAPSLAQNPAPVVARPRTTAATVTTKFTVSGQATRHTVKSGETLSGIAKANGTTVSALAKANGIANPNKIRAGQQIVLTTANTATHTVRSGESLSRIAARNGTSATALARANHISNPNVIHPGQRIVIDGNAAKTAEPARTQPQLDGGQVHTQAKPAAAGLTTQLPVVKVPPAAKPQIAPPVTKVQTPTKSIAPQPANTPPARQADTYQRIGNLISHGEGGYESYNAGTLQGKVQISRRSPPNGTVTGKTINEILATGKLAPTDPNRLFATGKYQTIIPTLKSAKAAMGLSGNERYTPEMQERVFREYLIGKAGGGKLKAFIDRGQGTVDSAQYAAAKEWASIAVPAGLSINGYTDKNKVYHPGPISNGRLSYYESKANHASMAATNALRTALEGVDATRPAAK